MATPAKMAIRERNPRRTSVPRSCGTLHVYQLGRGKWSLVYPNGMEVDAVTGKRRLAALCEHLADLQARGVTGFQALREASFAWRQEHPRKTNPNRAPHANPSLRREVTDIVREAERHGCRVKPGKHWKMLCPGGSMVVFSKTPSDQFALKKIRAEFRRAGVALDAHRNPEPKDLPARWEISTTWAQIPETAPWYLHTLAVRLHDASGDEVGNLWLVPSSPERWREPSCQEALADLQTRGFLPRRFFAVTRALVREADRGKGYGVALYEGAFREVMRRYGEPAVFAPEWCVDRHSSPAALRVWTSLARRWPSSGYLIAAAPESAAPVTNPVLAELLSWS